MPVILIRFEFLRPGAGLVLLAMLCVLAGPSANAAAVPVMLNEILANNRSLTNASGATPDWVELFNPSPAAVNLGGMSLSDSLATPQRWVFPAGAVVAAGGYLVIDCDGGAPPSAVNTGFGLRAEGDSLYLIDSPARGSNVLDEVAFGLQVADLTIGRVGTNRTWALATPTPGRPNAAVTIGEPGRLAINEWMAKAASGSDWFEVYNPENQPVALGGLWLSSALIKSPVWPLSFLGTGRDAYQVFLADKATNSGANHVGFKLSSAGASIDLSTASGTAIDAITFGPQTQGVSEGRLPDGTSNIVQFVTTASPGRRNHLPVMDVVINEVITHTDPPFEDAIELYNLSTQPIDIGGWHLSDTRTDPKRYRIPSDTVLAPNGYAVFCEYQFNALPGVRPSFELSAMNGGWVVLSAVDAAGNLTGANTTVSFSAIENGVSIGRYATSTGVDFVPLSTHTFGVDNPNSLPAFRAGKGKTNAYPRVGPVVISELMYHPVSRISRVENRDEEYVELQNITDNVVPLYLPTDPTNGWQLRGAVDYVFPPLASLAPHGFMLLVGFDPQTNLTALASFQEKYALTNSQIILGPFRGRLNDEGERIELWEAFRTGWSLVFEEAIQYTNCCPWPKEADGTGLTLQRIASAQYGNDPVNWKAEIPTPGAANLAGSPTRDTDGDGLPDTWEWINNLNPLDPTDAARDEDGDVLSNLQEYLSGTDPSDALSCLNLTASVVQGELVLSFNDTASAASYIVQSGESVVGGSWMSLTNVNAGGSGQTVNIRDSLPHGSSERFYRLLLRH